MASAWQSAPPVEQSSQGAEQGSQPAWMSAPAVDYAPREEARQDQADAPRYQEAPSAEASGSTPSREEREPRRATGLLGIPGEFTEGARSAADSAQEQAYPGWADVAGSEAFQQGDTRARHDLRQQYFRENIAPGLEGEERRQAERDFYNSPQADIRGTVEGSSWQPSNEGLRSSATGEGADAESAPSLPSNALRNAGERGLDLTGNTIQFIGNMAEMGEKLITDTLGGLNPGIIGGESSAMRERGYEPDIEVGGYGLDFTTRARPEDTDTGLVAGGQAVEDVGLGYKPNYTIDRALDEPSFTTLAGAAAEQGPAALADMLGLVVNPPAYLAARTQEIGEARVENSPGKMMRRASPELREALKKNFDDGTPVPSHLKGELDRLGMPSWDEYSVAGPTAAASVLVDRFALGKLLPGGKGAVTRARQIPGAVGRAGATEAATEAIQEGGIEYAGESVGTEEGWDPVTAGRRAAGGAIVGGPTGGAVRAGTATYEATRGGNAEENGSEQAETPPSEAQPGQPSPEAQQADAEVIGTAAELIRRPRFELSSAEREVRDSLTYGDAFKALRSAAEAQGNSEAVAELDAVSEEVSAALEAETMARTRGEDADLEPIRQRLDDAAQRFTGVMERINGQQHDSPRAEAPAQNAQPEPMGLDMGGGDQGAQTTASVPTMMTNGMRQDLRNLGYQDADIRKMRPQEAWDIINQNGQAPAGEEVRTKVDEAAAETDTEPTPGQAEAGNYRKGKVRLNGFEIAIENPKGSTRRGTAPDGTEWENQMAHHYGDIKGTTAADGDNLDVFVGDNPEAPRAFIIDQVNEDGSFDEHKVMLGFDSLEEARQGYLANYDEGWQGLGEISEVSVDDLKGWVRDGAHDMPFSDMPFSDMPARTEAEAPRVTDGRLPGRTETTYLPDNTPLETQFRVMDASQVRASNLPDGRQNPDYDPDLQPRDRSGQNSQVQVRNIAANLNPARLGSNPEAGSGAPIIGPDGMVESGNGRFMAIQTAYQQGRGDNYRRFVRQQAIDAGMDPAEFDAMEAPMLVRERQTEIDRADLGRRANDASAARMSPVETALADAERITAEDLVLWNPDQSGDPLAASNRDFQRRFAQRIGENEAAGLRNPRTGRFTSQMSQRMTAAVMGRAYRDADGRPAADVVELVAEQSDQMRNLQAGLQAGAVDLAMAYETGDAAAVETVNAIVDATRIVRRARDEGVSVRELVAQVDAFDGEVSPLARDMALMINTNMRSQRAMVDAFRYIGEQTRTNAESQSGSMFEDAPAPTTEEITRAGFSETEAEAQDAVAGEPAGQDGDAGRPGEGERQPAEGREADPAEGAPEAQDVAIDQDSAPAESSQNDAESLTLETQTEESLATRERDQQQAEQAEADRRRQEEERAQADRDADDFLLTGSDTAADQAMARGQDSLFAFAGERARTADPMALESAQQRLARGDDPDTVRRETGWFEGNDGKWRFEIDDSQAALLPTIETLAQGQREPASIDRFTYRAHDDGTYTVELYPEGVDNLNDIVRLVRVRREVLDAMMPAEAVTAIDQDRGVDEWEGMLDDAGLTVRDAPFQFRGFNALPLEQVLHHPKLFSAYPQLRNVLVQVDPELGSGAAFLERADGSMAAIRLGRSQQLSSLLHEIQHGIQNIEGFARGGSPSTAGMLRGDAEYARQRVNEMRSVAIRGNEEAYREAVMNMPRGGDTEAPARQLMDDATREEFDRWTSILQDYRRRGVTNAPRDPMEAYRRLAGEAEARNVQARQGMSEAERQAAAPSETQDVPDSDVVVVFNGEEMANAPTPENADTQPEAYPQAPRAEDIRARLAGHPELSVVEVVQSSRELPREVQLIMALQGVQGGDVSGVYNPETGAPMIVADNLIDEADAIRKAVHEGVGHYGIRGMLGQELEPLMLEIYQSHTRSEGGRRNIEEIQQAYPFIDVSTRKGKITLAEELVAHYIEDSNGRPKLSQRIKSTIRRLLRKLFPGIQWRTSDILVMGDQARRWLRRQQAARDVGDPRFAMAGDTASRNFKRWFGDSKVVDENGEPKVVYHGSPDVRGIIGGGFSESPTRGSVFFFTDSPAVAETYADDSRAFDYQNAEPHTLPLYLSMQNPLVVDAKGARWRDTERHIQEAREGGHDGIIIRNSRDEYNNLGNGGRLSTVYAVFEPTQAKSAATGNLRSRIDGIDLGDISNRGTYDPNSPDIRYSIAQRQADTSAQDLAAQLREEYPGLKLDLAGRGQKVTLSRIVTPEREQGTGSAVMRRLTDWADASGRILALTPSRDFGGNVKRLREFYRRFGFVENKGRNKDYEISEAMYREPDRGVGEVRFSLASQPGTVGGKFSSTDSTGFAMPDESLVDTALRKMADKMRPLKILEESIRRTGRDIEEEADAYLAEELFHGKVEYDLRQLQEQYVEPLAEGLAKAKISQADLDDYLYARHAPERNATIAERNPDDPEMQDGGSGMTNTQAAEIIERVANSGKQAEYDRLAQLVYDMTRLRREAIREGGLEDDAVVDAWEANWQYYVPLKGNAADEPGRPRTGRGFEISGRESRIAAGRTSLADSPSSQVIVDVNESLIRRRKNEVAQSLLSLVTDNPNPALWEVFTDDNPDTQRTPTRVTDPETGQVRIEVQDRPVNMSGNDRYFKAKRAGRTYYLKIHDERLMNAMRNVGPENNSTLIRAAGAVTRVMSSLVTSYNPEFMLTNFARDVQTALLNLSAEQTRDDGKIKGEAIVRQTARDIGPAMRAAWRGLQSKEGKNDGSREWDQWFREFQEDGAKTGYFDMKDLNAQAKEIQSMIRRADGTTLSHMLKARKKTADFVENMNGAVENAVRLSAYANARRSGISRKKAASLAKNMTVNFNRRGEAGTALNAAYMFANASIQGTMNFARTMVTVKDAPEGKSRMNVWARMNRAQKLGLGMATGSFMLGMLNRWLSDEDDDGVLFYDKIPDYEKERSLILMTGWMGGDPEDYIKIPLPYGYNVFSVVGTHAEAVAAGAEDATEAAKNLVLAVAGSFSPIGFEDSDEAHSLFLKNLTPTIFRSITQIGVNENFSGRPIYREDFPFGTPTPDSSRSFRSTPEAYQGFASFLNEFTGGTDNISGAIDVSPDVMRHLVNYYGGGAWGFVEKSADFAKRTATGEEVERYRVPFVGRFMSDVSEYGDMQRFYERRDELGQIANEAESLKGRERIDFRRDHQQQLRLFNRATDLEKRLSDLRKRRDRIEETETLSDEAKKRRTEMVEKQMKRWIDDFNRRYNEIE